MAEKSKDVKAQTINISVLPDSVRLQFAQVVMVGHTPFNFSLDFVQIAPTGKETSGVVVSRIAIPPGVAKSLITVLQTRIERFEKEHGPITSSDFVKLKETGNGNETSDTTT